MLLLQVNLFDELQFLVLTNRYMDFDLKQATAILERTPASFSALLNGLPPDWIKSNEGEGTWNAMDVVAHLIYLDRANWLHRTKLLLTTGEMVRFDPLNQSGGKALINELNAIQLLYKFHQTRNEVLAEIQNLHIKQEQYSQTAIHPDFGVVKLSQLLSAWVVHDLSHLSQVCRVMSRQYKEEVGPWVAFLKILQ